MARCAWVWSVREVVNHPKEHSRDAERKTDDHRYPRALGVNQENGVRDEEQRRQDSAKDEGTTAVVMYGSLRISMK